MKLNLSPRKTAVIFKPTASHCLFPYKATSRKLFSTSLFSKTQLFEDSIHPRQRMGEQKTAIWVTENKDSVRNMINHDKGTDASELHDYLLDRPIWSNEELANAVPVHRPAKKIKDYLAYGSIQMIRFFFDLFSGYHFGKLTPRKVITRVVFLETVAGVPGMVGAMIRHLHSLRLMRRDYGWIHTLLEEAENERMHLLTAIKLMKPSYITRLFVLLAQGVFVNFWFLTYLISPKFCHRFVGYLEEEAVKTYTHIIKNIDDGTLEEFKKMKAPEISIRYWRLSNNNSTMRDMFLAMRADEYHHCEVNHGLADKNAMDKNPWFNKRTLTS